MARLEVTVDVDPDAPASDDGLHVTGTVRDEHGAETRFVGWVGLFALIQRALMVDPR